MNHVIKVEFPCGYFFSSDLQAAGFTSSASVDTDKLPVCPLHGKLCRRGGRK